MPRQAYLLGLCILLGGLGVGVQADGLSVSIATPRLARTFYPGDSIALNVTSFGPSQPVHYVVTDFDGVQVLEGEVQMGDSASMVIDPPDDLPFGIYYLMFTREEGQQIEDAFCVIPRPDAVRDDELTFGWHYCGEDENVFRLLGQVGCRLIRCDVDWVSANPREGEWSVAKPERKAALATKYGMQLIPILGYTPVYEGIKAVNATGRAATATHTWPPRTTTNWQHYVRITAESLNSFQTQWPAVEVLPDAEPDVTVTVPLVRAWEIWNEVDQSFYYGYWPRYLDLLRIAYCELHHQDRHAKIVYGGSCGHWTELGKTFGAGGQYYYDALNIHIGSDFNDSLEAWYCGAPQIGYGYGVYRETTFTECYIYPYEGLSYAESLLRTYSTLRAWGVREFCSFDGGRIIGEAGPDSYAMVSVQDGELVPNAAYIAQAVARWLLADAGFIGEILLDGAPAHVYLRDGQAMLVTWADSDTEVEVKLDQSAEAETIDWLGRRIALEGASAQLSIGPCALAIIGVDQRYVAGALGAFCSLQLDTPAGFETERDFGYISTLRRDLDSRGGIGWARQFEEAVQWACEVIRERPTDTPRVLGVLQQMVHNQMLATLNWTGNYPSLCKRANPVLHRLSKITRALGAMADAYAAAIPDLRASPAELRAAREQLEQTEAAAFRRCPDGTVPRARVLLDLAWQQLSVAEHRRGPGSLLAAKGLTQAAQKMFAFDEAVNYEVFAVADFPSATHFVKRIAFVPGQEHIFQVRVYNYTGAEVSGMITWTLPETWSASETTAEFAAPAAGYSDPIDFTVTIPGEPTPWVTKMLWTAAGSIPVELPEPLAVSGSPSLSGELSDGRKLPVFAYDVGVGEWTEAP